MGIEETLLQKVKQNNDAIGNLSANFEKLNTLIIGNGKVGIAEEVRNNTKFRKNTTKLIWFLISGAIGQTITLTALLINLLK